MLVRFAFLAVLFCAPSLHAQLRPFVACGSGVTLSSGGNKGIVGCGAGFTKSIYSGEIGFVGPESTHSSFSGYGAFDVRMPLTRADEKHTSPYALGGYSYLFQVGHAANYGVGTHIPMPYERRMFIELRNSTAFADPTQQYLMLRIGWIRPAE